MGDPDVDFGRSQYQSTFQPNVLLPNGFEKKGLPPSAFPASKQCIIVEDFPDRKTGSSLQKDDFKAPSFYNQKGAHAQQLGKATKVLFSKKNVWGAGLIPYFRV